MILLYPMIQDFKGKTTEFWHVKFSWKVLIDWMSANSQLKSGDMKNRMNPSCLWQLKAKNDGIHLFKHQKYWGASFGCSLVGIDNYLWGRIFKKTQSPTLIKDGLHFLLADLSIYSCALPR
ncbi:hypothetical protein V8G54_028742 [Vigna mungo]|uniref:Uncharacterized protein n=1 Tax=Vigna mungo TaxID=3915 RepID=A0AAQ3MT55_VIGMU